MRRIESAAVPRCALLLLAVTVALPAHCLGQRPATGAAFTRVRSVASAEQAPRTVLTMPSPLRDARVLFVRSRSEFLHASLLEKKLMARPEFSRLGLAITREASEAEIVIDVERSSFTTKFTYSLLDPSTEHVLATGQVNSLFGTASGKIAKAVMKTLVRARTL